MFYRITLKPNLSFVNVFIANGSLILKILILKYLLYEAPFTTKELSNNIMHRSRLKNKYLKWSSRENFLPFRNAKQQSFLEVNLTFSNKQECQKLWLHYSKGRKKNINNESEVAQIFNKHNIKITSCLYAVKIILLTASFFD